MIYSKFNALSYLNGTPTKSSIPKLFSIFSLYTSTLSPRYCTTSVDKRHPFPVSYLISTCGFSLEDAILVSKQINLKTPEKPDVVINFFKKHGFSNHHLLGIFKSDPSLLLCNPEKSILPKFEFLHSRGVPDPEIVKIFYKKPTLLRRSVKNHFIPSYNLLRTLYPSDERLVSSIQRCPSIIAENFTSRVWPNISLLRGNGVPAPKIVTLLDNHPATFVYRRPDELEKLVEEVKKLGFQPSKYNFLQALSSLVILSKTKWQRKFDAYKQWGWSEEEFYVAFRLYPWIMSTSEEKIIAIMKLLVNHLGVKPSAIVRKPVILGMSLEKRLIPRVSVIQFLLSKRLLTKERSWLSLFMVSDKAFLEKIVTNFEEESPQLLKIYSEKLDNSENEIIGIMERV